MSPLRMEYDLLIKLAAAKVGAAIDDLEQVIIAEPDNPRTMLWRDVKDCLHDAHEALTGVHK